MASVNKEEPPNAVGTVFQGLGQRLKRTFTGDSGHAHTTTPPTEMVSTPKLSDVTFIAAGVAKKADTATDYRYSAKVDLMSAKRQLQQAIENIEVEAEKVAGIRKEVDEALQVLARIHAMLGDYGEVERIYARICPFPSRHGSLGLSAASAVEKWEMDIALDFLNFLARTGRNLRVAENLSREILQQRAGFWSSDEQLTFQLSRIRVSLHKNDRSEALSRIHDISTTKSIVSLVRARIAVGFFYAQAWLSEGAHSKRNFVITLVSSAVIYGIWHSDTLEMLYYYGIALKTWGHHEAASLILAECCIGRFYRFGPSHPDSGRARSELESCEESHGYLGALRNFEEFGTFDIDVPILSTGYEHVYLNCVISLLQAAGETTFEDVEKTLEEYLDESKPLKVETTEHRAIVNLRIRRALAWCKYEQGNVTEAIALLEGLSASIKRSSEGELQTSLDLAVFYQGENKSKASELSQAIFFDVDVKLNQDQASTFRRILSRLNLTHFSYDTVSRNPLPIKVLENVGTGAYAIVESVKINGRLYARKSIALPRYNQNRIRETIQNEISVIKTLVHPHIVGVYCTYEERSRFAIVLEPLADCDLEAFLEQRKNLDATKPDTNHNSLVGKWFYCLANTLAFIHSKGIRHKDIKTRNILVKGSEVIFSDFGSSHAFLEEGNSVTEGPSFGHTLMYCAPEVVSWDKRSRSADIFSLGCVFSEMATFIEAEEIADYYDFRAKGNVTGTSAYHATLERVEDWFGRKHDDPQSWELYTSVIRPMLSKDPAERPTASESSTAIQKYFVDVAAEEVPKCDNCQPPDCIAAAARSAYASSTSYHRRLESDLEDK